MKPDNMLKLIEMLMERISTLESATNIDACLMDGYRAEIKALKKENEQLQVEKQHLQAALVEKQAKLSGVHFAETEGACADDED